MSLWNCIKCNCQQIAADLGFCPACYSDRAETAPEAPAEVPEAEKPSPAEKPAEAAS